MSEKDIRERFSKLAELIESDRTSDASTIILAGLLLPLVEQVLVDLNAVACGVTELVAVENERLDREFGRTRR